MINPIDSLNSGVLVLQLEPTDSTIAEKIQETCNPFIKAPSTIIKTEHGFTVIIPPEGLGGSKVEVEQLGGGYYLIKKTSCFGTSSESIIMSEKEFVEAFGGFKTQKEIDEKIDIKRIISHEPYNYFRTKSGYIIKLLNGNNVTGASAEVKAQADGTYLVTTRAYGGAPAEKEILSEQELVAKFGGEKVEIPDKIYHLVA